MQKTLQSGQYIWTIHCLVLAEQHIKWEMSDQSVWSQKDDQAQDQAWILSLNSMELILLKHWFCRNQSENENEDSNHVFQWWTNQDNNIATMIDIVKFIFKDLSLTALLMLESSDSWIQWNMKIWQYMKIHKYSDFLNFVRTDTELIQI